MGAKVERITKALPAYGGESSVKKYLPQRKQNNKCVHTRCFLM